MFACSPNTKKSGNATLASVSTASCPVASPHPPHGPRHSRLPDSTTHSPSPSPFLLSPLLRLCPIPLPPNPRRISGLQHLFLLRFSLSLQNWCAAQLKTSYEIDSTLSRCSPSLCPPIDPLPRCQYLLAPPLIQYSPKPMYRFVCQPQIFPAVDPEARLA